MQYEYESMALDTVLEVKETYYELCSAQQVLKIALDEAGVLMRLETAAQSVYASGQSGQQDVLKAQAETTMLKPRILELEARINGLKSKLNVLLGRSADAPIEVAAPLGFPELDKDAATLRAIAEENSPEIEQAGASLARSKIERRLMGREYFPDYRLGAEYRTFRNEDPNMVMFMVGMDIPVWRSKYRAEIREAERWVASSQAALEASRQQVGLDVQQAYFNVKSAREALGLYRNTLIPQAQSRFNASEAGYRGGTVSFLDLLESQRFLLNARVMAAMAESNLGMQLARLERALGTDLKPGSPESAPVTHQGAEHE
jgi:outer membrane protein TolC